MAFIGLVFAGIAVIIFFAILFLAFAFTLIAIIFKIQGQRRNSKKMRITGNVFLVLGILCSLPVFFIIGLIVFNFVFQDVTLPNGDVKYVLTSDVKEMKELAFSSEPNTIDELNYLLDSRHNLVFYHDVNHKSILDYGLEQGNADVVKAAINHEAIFDNPIRYDIMAYVDNSMDFYLDETFGRSITEDDIEIISLMFEKGTRTDYYNENAPYSNMLGKATYLVLSNDETITDIEIEFIQVFIDNGITHDNRLPLFEDLSINHSFSSESHLDVQKDDNYYKLMDMIGR